jgi:hypothetical protein
MIKIKSLSELLNEEQALVNHRNMFNSDQHDKERAITLEALIRSKRQEIAKALSPLTQFGIPTGTGKRKTVMNKCIRKSVSDKSVNS